MQFGSVIGLQVPPQFGSVIGSHGGGGVVQFGSVVGSHGG